LLGSFKETDNRDGRNRLFVSGAPPQTPPPVGDKFIEAISVDVDHGAPFALHDQEGAEASSSS
jgi:hypothetical protein